MHGDPSQTTALWIIAGSTAILALSAIAYMVVWVLRIVPRFGP